MFNWGTEGTAAQSSRAAAALRAYLEARQKGEWATACFYLVPATRRLVQALTATASRSGPGCAPAYAALYTTSPASARANPFGELVALRVKGDHASALFLGPGNAGYAMPMTIEGSAWKVNQISPIPYPPAAAGG